MVKRTVWSRLDCSSRKEERERHIGLFSSLFNSLWSYCWYKRIWLDSKTMFLFRLRRDGERKSKYVLLNRVKKRERERMRRGWNDIFQSVTKTQTEKSKAGNETWKERCDDLSSSCWFLWVCESDESVTLTLPLSSESKRVIKNTNVNGTVIKTISFVSMMIWKE